MVVVDNDVISYFWLESARSGSARKVRRQDGMWAAPFLWRNEFRSVLAQHMHVKGLPYNQALRFVQMAERDMQGREYSVPAAEVLKLAGQTGHSAYDCEYVALAQMLGVPLVTGDKQLPAIFPGTAILLEDFTS